MYSMERDTYICDFCSVEIGWDETKEPHGEMWGCEKCGRAFCTKCFIDRFSRKVWMDMMQDCQSILCPTCKEEQEKRKDGGI